MKKVLLVLAIMGFFCTACEPALSENTLQLSLGGGGTKVGLGDKIQGYYRLYWEPTDKVLCNGEVSGEALIGKRTSVAEFQFENLPQAPYSIVFPVVEGVQAKTTNCYPVEFLATQHYTEDTFESKAAPMYCYTSKQASTLSHLTGTVRFLIKGDVTISNIVLTSDSKPISGIFDLNCKTGEVIAQDGNTSYQAEVVFDNGFTLSPSKSTPIYFTLPAGDIGKIDVLINATNGEKMNFFITCDSTKPIRAGIVREVNEFEFLNTGEKNN